MRIRLLWVGKGRDRIQLDLLKRYLERLERYVRVSTVTVPDAEGRGRSRDETRRLEADRLRAALARDKSPGASRLVALDERGEQRSTRELAEELAKEQAEGLQQINYLIGGPEGLDPDLIREADRCLSLSRLTFTHELSRVLLAEQLFRACSLNAGHPYHRD